MHKQKIEGYEKKFWDILEGLFSGAEVDGNSGYVNLLKVKRKYFKNYLRPKLIKYVNCELKELSDFKEELYQKLYSFFHRYFSETGSIYFSYTPLYYKIYNKVYKNEERKKVYFKPSEYDYNTDFEQILSDKNDVSLFWKTYMLYYIKTDKIIRSMKVEFPEKNLYFYFDASEIELKKANEKKQLIYKLKKILKDGTIVLKVLYSEKGKKTKEQEIIKQIKKSNKYTNLTEELLKKAIKTFEKQANVDYFINKDPEKFLKEQFNLWMYQYLFSRETNFDLKRFRQLQALKNIAYRIIEFIAQFEDELKKIWEKPRLVFNSNYVITLDRIAKKENRFEIINEIINQLKKQEKEFKRNLKELEKIKTNYKSFKERFENYNIKNQLEEWYLLDIIDKDFVVDKILKKNSHGWILNEKWQFLPVDTKYFYGLIEKIENIFDDDKELDGRLIKSENWQALNTILPKYKEKVQTIYIDPPFNLGTEADFHYEVNYKDSTWITMLENRISLAKNLLKEEGSIFVRCDYNGNMYLRMLLDEIFGKENFRNELIINRTKKIFTGVKGYNVANDSLFFYGKSKNFFFNPVYKKRVKEQKWLSMHSPGERKPPERIILGKILYPPKGRHWTFVQEKIHELEKKGRIRINPDIEYIDIIGNLIKGMPQYLTSEEELLDSNWTDIPGYSQRWGFPTENSEFLLKRVIETSSKKNDVILDFFLGSGTTVAVSHKLKRKWIGIELGEHFYTVILPRIKKVLFYDKSGISRENDVKELYNQRLAGGFFKYYELEQYEDILKTVDYANTDVKEYYKKLEKMLGKDFRFSKTNPFLFDKKLAKSIKIQNDNNIKIDLSRLYPNKRIDVKETLTLNNSKEIRRILLW